MQFLKQIIKQPYFCWGFTIVGLSCVFFMTRLPNLTLIPIFTDEAIYLRWTQIGLADPRWRFISLIDGKQPLLIWLFLPALKYMGDPLFAGRLVSVLLGFTGMAGLAAFLWYLTRSYKGLVIGGLLYIIFPFFMAYDRMALYEALLTTETVWMLFLAYLLGRKLRLDIALLLGTVIGFGLLTKSSANYFWILLPATLLLVDWRKKKTDTLLSWFSLALVVIMQSQIYNHILRLSEFRHVIGEKNLQFLYSFSEILQNPFKYVSGNTIGLMGWLWEYLTWPLGLFMLTAVIWQIKRNMRVGLFFLAYFFIPFASLAFFGKVLYPRFLIFMVVPLLIPTGLFLVHLWKSQLSKPLLITGVFFIFLPSLYFDYKVLVDPIRAPWPETDKKQFISDWPAGYGVKEVVEYLKNEARKGPIVVGTEGTFGLYPMAFELYLGRDPNITFKPYWPVNEVPEELRQDAKTRPTFLAFKERQDIPDAWPLRLIQKYQRGDGPTYLKFYQVLP